MWIASWRRCRRKSRACKSVDAVTTRTGRVGQADSNPHNLLAANFQAGGVLSGWWSRGICTFVMTDAPIRYGQRTFAGILRMSGSNCADLRRFGRSAFQRISLFLGELGGNVRSLI